MGYFYDLAKLGLDRDRRKAFHLYSLAAIQGNYVAQYNLALLCKVGDRSYGRQILTFIQSGETLGAPDERRAFDLLTMAAAQGYPQASYSLGLMHEKGVGVKEDRVKAFALFKIAAKKGVPEAQLKLGLCYEIARGVRQNLPYVIPLSRGYFPPNLRQGEL